MEVVFDQIVIDSEKTEMVHYRMGRAPTELEDYTSAIFKLFNMARDAMLTEGKALMEAFLRSQICDLKCEI
ncbi:unnamed protein product [Arctia plantaginis]|uniref:Uncharacterized protein n=1 Tax=Arctia plantaginis TaxID=874455 RepID=A0A8S0ZL89_ARCPL|nr:unnamed protein product [Arctia plantaginis]